MLPDRDTHLQRGESKDPRADIELSDSLLRKGLASDGGTVERSFFGDRNLAEATDLSEVRT